MTLVSSTSCSAVEQRAAVAGVVVDLLNGAANREGLRNFEGQLMLLASIPPDAIAPILDGLLAGSERASAAMQEKDADRQLGVSGIWHALHEPDVNLGMRAMIGFFGGFGAAWREAAERGSSLTRPQPELSVPARTRMPGPGGT